MFKKLIIVIPVLFLLSSPCYAGTPYPTDNPTVVNVSPALGFTGLSSFSETLGAGNEGSVKYQISNNGTNWYYWNGSTWVPATAVYDHSNTAAEVNTNCGQFDDDVGSGDFYFKAFLHSDGTQAVELDEVTLGYVTNEAPSTPTNSSPAEGATGQDLNVTLTGSAYSDPESDPHTDTQWQVDDDADFATPVWTRTASAGEITINVTSSTGTFANELSGKTELDHNTTYYWQVRYSDGQWSSWSTATNFTTNLINAPTNSSPANGATVTTLTPLLEASAFSDDQSGHTHAASQWQVDDNSDFSSVTYDSGETASGEISRAVPSGSLSNFTTYYWHVRYKDSSGFWSEFSTSTNFEISIMATAIEVLPVFGNTTVDQGDTVKIDTQVLNFSDGSPLNSATVTINIYNPSGTKIVDGDSMTYISGSNGIYRYSYIVPSTSGSYLYEVTATQASKTGYGAANFEVRTLAADVSSISSALTAHEAAQATERTLAATERTAQSAERTSQEAERTSAGAERTAQSAERTAQATERTSQATFRTDTAATLSDIETETDKIPLIKAETDKIKAEILNRETSVKSGSTIKIRYRSVSGLTAPNLPEMDVFDASNGQVVTDWAMTEIGATGVYARNLPLDSGWGTGEFTVVCADTTTGQLDSLSLSVLTTDLADIRAGITDVAAQITTVEGKIDTVDTNIDTLISEVGTGNIAAIKAKTDDIAWTDVTAIKTKTATIDWADVDAILLDTAEIQPDVDTLISEIGTGRITGIKTKTDTIAWSDVTAVKAKTDTINWTDVTNIKIDTDKIDSIQTTVEDTNSDVADINLDTDAVIAKWDTHKAADIVAFVDNVESRLGAPTDASTADTVFGDVKTLQDKWGDYTASDLYTGGGTGGTTGGSTVVPYTVGNEVLVAATDAYSQMEALRQEVRALGKTAPAYESLLSLQASLNRVSAALEKLETASTHPLYAQVLEVANQLKATGVVKGEKVMSLYEVSAKQAEDVEYLKAKLEELKALSELSKEIVAEKKKGRKKAIIRTNW
ncbi:hypothetical protein D4R42_03095 [bacterium]|nr:MAG: hypothetical protein D4R42_03095 [bacterium]